MTDVLTQAAVIVGIVLVILSIDDDHWRKPRG